jgi:RND family efflux transporter MFP subunit
VRATPGASVAPGDVLFKIVDTAELWIRARVPEQDASRIQTEQNAAYQPSGLAQWLPLTVVGDQTNASLVDVGRVVDATSRTVDVIYSLKSPDPRLRVGALVRVSLPLGERFSGVVVPRTAVLEEDGRTVVYVQLDGEHFEERTVRLGPSAAGVVAIQQGLEPGARIVTQGGNFIRLASQKGSGQAHGHIH